MERESSTFSFHGEIGLEGTVTPRDIVEELAVICLRAIADAIALLCSDSRLGYM